MEPAVHGFDFVHPTWDHIITCAAGLLLSTYALYVEVKKKRNPQYVAMCDISDSMKCSRVLTSEYSQGFGLVHLLLGKESALNVPNCVLGLIFYSLQLYLGFSGARWAVSTLFYTSVLACISSVYLSYILVFVLKDICIVCVCTYFVNFTLMYMSYEKFIVMH